MPGSQKALDLAALQRVRQLWHTEAQPLTLAELAAAGRSGRDAVGFARWTHREFQVRIAHRVNEFLFLPYKAMANPSINFVYQRYVDAYVQHEEVGDLNSQEAASKYWQVLADIFNANRQVTRALGAGRNEVTRLDSTLAASLDGFLDRFFCSRIGTSLAGSAFLHSFPGPSGVPKPTGVEMGVVQRTDVVACVHQLIESLASMSRSPGVSCPILVEGASEVWIDYVPSHIHVILREILQNAVYATAMRAEEARKEVEPVRVSINRGRFGVFVTISDRGGGFESKNIWSWGPLHPESDDLQLDLSKSGPEWADVEEDVPFNASYQDALAVQVRQGCSGAGFGAPLARLVARYFGGDVQLRTLLGHGTSAYIHIPELQREMSSMDGV